MSPGDQLASSTPMLASTSPRPRLVLQSSESKETVVACRRIVTLIGSGPGCKLALRSVQVSPVHLAIVNDGVNVFAVDMVTTHGTLLNGRKIEHERVSDGDTLSIGPWSFRVDIRQPSASESTEPHPFDLEPAPHAVALEHEASRRVLQSHRDVCIIGRRKGCDIVVSDERVSRVHALLFSYFGHPVLCDLHSHNGTLVNEKTMTFRALIDNDMMMFGDSSFRVRLLDPIVIQASPKVAASKNGTADAKTNGYVPPSADLIDIQAAEGSQKWRIADSLRKVARKPQPG